jgi:hypothetical protein
VFKNTIVLLRLEDSITIARGMHKPRLFAA